MSVPASPDLLSAATAPLTFHDFLDRMKHPAAADLVRSIKNFLVQFASRPRNAEEDSASVQEFLSQTEEAFRTHSLWEGAEEEELESAGEGLEKYLMTKLYSRAYAPLPEDIERDKKLSEKISALQQFVEPEHLDIPSHFQSEASLLLAQKELQKIGSFKAPRDKLVCILNCCRVINNLLLNASLSLSLSNPAGGELTPPGADDFLPVLIFVLLKANPPQLLSTIAYIQNYRHSTRLVSESAYFFTNLVSATTFIENVDAASLSMPPKEFETKMKIAKDSLAGNSSLPETSSPSLPENSSLSLPKPSSLSLPKPSSLSLPENSSPSLSLVDNSLLPKTLYSETEPAGSSSTPPPSLSTPSLPKPVNLETERETIPSSSSSSSQNFNLGTENGVLKNGLLEEELQRDFTFVFAKPGDLRVGDVEILLNEYKEVVLKYVTLLRANKSSTTVEKKVERNIKENDERNIERNTERNGESNNEINIQKIDQNDNILGEREENLISELSKGGGGGGGVGSSLESFLFESLNVKSVKNNVERGISGEGEREKGSELSIGGGGGGGGDLPSLDSLLFEGLNITLPEEGGENGKSGVEGEMEDKTSNLNAVENEGTYGNEVKEKVNETEKETEKNEENKKEEEKEFIKADSLGEGEEKKLGFPDEIRVLEEALGNKNLGHGEI